MELSSIKETCLYVKDLEACKQFYQEILGLKLINYLPGRHLFFRVGQNVLLCFNPEATKSETHVPPHFAYGKQHIAFEVPKDEYSNWKEKLSRCLIITHEHHWKNELYSFYFEDPDGNVLEIVMPGIWD